MTNSITIDRLHASYEDVTAEHAIRLDRALHDLAAGALEAELVPGLHLTPYAVCVPALAAPVRLDPSLTISAVAQAWARQLSDAIRGRIEDDDVVVYQREIDAIIDLARTITAGSRHASRSWAWHQLGLLDAERPPRVDDLVAALVPRAELITAVLGSFPHPFSVPLGPGDWIGLSQAVHQLLRAGAATAPHVSEGQQHTQEDTEDVASSVTALVGATGQSLLQYADALVDAWRDASSDHRVALVSLLLAVGQPISINDRRARVALATHLDAIAGTGRQFEIGNDPETVDQAPAETGRAAKASTPEQETAGGVHTDEPAPRVEEPSNHGTGLADPSVSSIDKGISAEVTTRHGGTFFLTHVVDELGLIDKYLHVAGHMAGELLARAVATVVGVAWTDPAVASVAGLDEIDAAVTNRMLGQLDPVAEQAVEAVVTELVAWLSEHLEPDHTGPVSTWNWVWRRGAKIERDPGWIEIELSVEAADPRIRRAGLDLDPGFVWWLGAVMRFRYV